MPGRNPIRSTGIAMLLLVAGATLAWGAPRILPRELFNRTQAVFYEFGLPAESDSADQAKQLQIQGGLNDIQSILPYFDPWNGFARFAQVGTDGIAVFQDRDSRTVPDFSVSFAHSAEDSIAGRPLAGLKIAIDPGHMGGEPWDRRAEKYVIDPQGREIGEGLLTLQTALLLEEKLTALGAQVLLTRRDLAPVTREVFENYDLKPYADSTFRESALLPWFQQLLSLNPVGPELYRSFHRDSNVRAIYSEARRASYFLTKADLLARARLINEFSPDLTLILHFDTARNPHEISHGYNGTKAYVPGAYLPEELATRENRLEFIRQLSRIQRWKDSVRLSQSIVDEIRSQLKLPIDASGGGSSVREVVPGVFSRNLVLTREIQGSALAFLECFFYNDSAEFAALLQKAGTLTIGGRDYPYSNRLVQLSNAIRDGIIQFSSDR